MSELCESVGDRRVSPDEHERLAHRARLIECPDDHRRDVLAHALDLLLGGRARPGIVRPGAAEAYVDGVFELPDALRAALGERLPPDAEELVLARRLSAEGRTRAYLNGRSASVADLREAAEGLIAFYGQHEHRKLTLASSQLELLDGACGPQQATRRARYTTLHLRVRELE